MIGEAGRTKANRAVAVGRLPVIVGDRVRPDQWDADRTLVVHPGRTSWPDIAEWLDARLDVEDLPDSD